jgi:hypothetical protein
MESDKRYYDKQVDWQYFDIDKDGILDLIETITTKKGDNKGADMSIKKYLFKNSQFVKLADKIILASNVILFNFRIKASHQSQKK